MNSDTSIVRDFSAAAVQVNWLEITTYGLITVGYIHTNVLKKNFWQHNTTLCPLLFLKKNK